MPERPCVDSALRLCGGMVYLTGPTVKPCGKVSMEAIPRFQERCQPFDLYTRGLEDMNNAALQRGCQS
jgi:hypothetical protein